MDIDIDKFTIKNSEITEKSGTIYTKLGLKVEISPGELKIYSTKDSVIKSVGKNIHIHIRSIRILESIIEEGFCSKDVHHTMPLEFIDDLGNTITTNYIPIKNRLNIAILTSGGDAPGMNPAIRAIVRTGIKWNAKIFGVLYGYEGLINDKIIEMNWDEVNNHNTMGGTCLFSARSTDFSHPDGRKLATLNLVKRKITGLIILGGDGSLAGGYALFSEFRSNIEILMKEGKLPINTQTYDLKLIGVPASIDNDISYSDATLGSDSALHRVIESVDNLSSTMISHQRAFVIEVMGRNCGWIAMMSSFATGADYVFLPEVPDPKWKKSIVDSINTVKHCGKRGIFVVISEGAVDENGVLIKAETVKQIIEKETNMETRVLKLGHTQRGGAPSAYDRILGTVLGCKTIEHLLSKPVGPPVIVSIIDGEYKFTELSKVIKRNNEIKNYIKNKDFENLLSIRGTFFKRCYLLNQQLRLKNEKSDSKKKIAILHEGKRAAGMNTALNAIIQYGISLSKDIYVIHEGFGGILKNMITKAENYEFYTSMNSGGSVIGTSMCTDIDCKKIYKKLKESKITSLIVIGGSGSLKIVNNLKNMNHKRKDTPMDFVIIPATISNNMPGTDISIGSDTALNCISIASDLLRLSSVSMNKSVFVVEVQGDRCGYLALMGAIAAGAFDNFIPERKYKMSHLSDTAERLKVKFRSGHRHGVVLIRNEKTFQAVSTDSFSKMLKADSQGLFDTRFSVLGHLQSGGNPSPIDRVNAIILGIKALDIILGTDKENIIKGSRKPVVGILGLKGQGLVFTPLEECITKFDFTNKRDKNPTWMHFSNICRSIE
ncbi:6-phosphofructokinase [Hamiltosporidium tvaerminnensis]|uniref:6-phosphofructokinase n=1 Tax=Hamiltosporidium tvaerminnensis TaxID=1176355 RepID=A0A4Q9L9W9_9MICR|nr:6-phosphofructokinase, alpha subunit [Hamiltosporidium tvaerminnensis]TBU03801.1 6-phosphofructokinase [Hamiltosporidium tvaerminnensis]